MSDLKSSVGTRDLDIICLGRAAVDLYGEQIGSRLEDMGSFAKYLGGSSGNIAYGTSRLGLRSAMLTRVGDEHMGRFVREEFEAAGVDTSHVVTDKDCLTGLVILGIKDQETFPLIFYRRDCADMALNKDDFSPEFIASSRSLLMTGTHLSTPSTYEACMKAVEYAKAAGTKVVLDIDYRPVLWGLTGIGEGENRFVSNEGVSQHLQTVLPHLDLIVGTEEEVHIAGGTTDTIAALKKIRELSNATIVLKLGALGCTVLDGAIPDSMDAFDVFTGVRVDVLNVLGAGDAFMSGFLRGWLNGKDYLTCCQYANACGALVVSRHGCAPAIPSGEELDYYIAHAAEIPRPDKDTELNYLHRVTTRRKPKWDEILGLAYDHRIQLFQMAREAGTDESRIKLLKQLLVKATQDAAVKANLEGKVGVLIDDTYGQDALNDVTGLGWWIGRPVELPTSNPIELEGGRSIGSRLKEWPLEHVVKCLIFYHPDQPIMHRLAQERQALELYKACCASGHELLLEIIPPKDMAQDEDTLVRSLERFYNLGIRPDWWKLPAPSRNTWEKLTQLINKRQPHCRGVVLLGLDAPLEVLKRDFANSKGFDICKGFTVGRTLWSSESRQWLANEINDEQFIELVSGNYQSLIESWRNR
ncbi:MULTISPECIES: 5-dehydro-2-deoxygluconokinase [unclassified Marinobacterium]|uniref:bifunctional 5-dehydro-2-deoxygluconokinase/5-dehydro-2- deoxyphosphogluconate aldolase n=1 Tax=unclassified Marinobacterium TaxID=2644139 RepID=UPI00156951D0|nr:MULTISPECIES: 5-dehydro-2-deoxygluconokinase [unclassified Marinobacterium]NRP53287.1 5-dehydro-2-deoxygluconokinase [Marinobacterium sp. xm-v-242]NRP78072.1 5-dehydro-2-deoxygluconokinase [Marinobacterium sp. xm-m-383]